MEKVYKTNESKRIEIEELIKSQEKLSKRMLSFFDGEKDIALRKCYEYLKESKDCAEVYLEKLKHEK